jgi:ParB family chromosome partitioning protein
MIRTVKLKDILPNPYQPRKSADPAAIQSLADEIQKVGFWGGLRGREKDGQIELCFGQRRLDALKLLKRKEVEVDIVPLTDEEMALQALIENEQREGLTDADKGEAIEQYVELRCAKGKSSREDIVEELGRILGYSRSRIHELRQIARLDEEVKQPIREHRIAGRTALAAHRFGGTEGVKAAIANSLSFGTMTQIQSTYAELPQKTEDDKAAKAKVVESFTKGKITRAEDVTTRFGQAQSHAYYRKVGATKVGGIDPKLYLCGLEGHMTRALEALQEIPDDAWPFIAEDCPGGVFAQLYLACKGLERLMLKHANPNDPKFQQAIRDNKPAVP